MTTFVPPTAKPYLVCDLSLSDAQWDCVGAIASLPRDFKQLRTELVGLDLILTIGDPRIEEEQQEVIGAAMDALRLRASAIPAATEADLWDKCCILADAAPNCEENALLQVIAKVTILADAHRLFGDTLPDWVRASLE